MSELAANHRGEPEQIAGDPESAWLAAYALGLAYSSRSHQDRVELLQEATRERPELLTLARHRLETTEVVEPGLRDRARRLLDRARTLSVSGTTPSPVTGDGW